MSSQLELFHIQQAYTEAQGPLSNERLYQAAARLAGISERAMDAKSPVGKAGSKRSTLKRAARWYQQTLKALGVLEKVPGERGVWQLASANKKGLHEHAGGPSLVAYSTKLGLALWANNQNVFSKIDEPIHLCLTSPPYPLRVKRDYGNVAEKHWVDFITRSLEPIVRTLVPGGSVVLNVSNDIFNAKAPSRSLYLERMVLALHDRLGLHLMDRIPWVNLSKPPAPTHWACVNRYQLCAGWEPVYWFTNDPHKVRSDNRRVLREHTERQQALIDSGGEQRTARYGDGAYRLTPGSFSGQTEGAIPKNVITRGHACADSRAVRSSAKALGLPAHPAMFPTELAQFLVRFLTKEQDLVVDPFGGANKTGLACERNNRRWIACETMLEYVRVQAQMFRQCEGFWLNPDMANVGQGGIFK